MLKLPPQQDVVQQQPLRDMFLLRGLKLRVEKELLVYGMPCFDDSIRLPLRNAQLVAMMLNEAASWQDQIQEGLRIATHQCTHHCIPDFCHLLRPPRVYFTTLYYTFGIVSS